MSENSKFSVTSADKLRRRRQPYPFQVNPGLTVMLKRMSMQTMLMENLIPMSLLDAVDRFEKIGEAVEAGKTSKEVMDATDPQDMKRMMDFMRHYACVIVAEPTIVLVDDQDPKHVPVDVFDSDELLAIWNATPPEEQEELKVSSEQAREFRGAAQPVDVPNVQNVGEARPTPVLVDTTKRKRISA